MRYLYAIERITDGKFLPRPPSGQKGGSWVEPTDPAVALPRFFARERDAKGFLTTWLKGPQTNSFTTDWETGIEEFEGAIPDPERAAEPRIASDWRVVRIEWRVGPPW